MDFDFPLGGTGIPVEILEQNVMPQKVKSFQGFANHKGPREIMPFIYTNTLNSLTRVRNWFSAGGASK